jgi:sortase A
MTANPDLYPETLVRHHAVDSSHPPSGERERARVTWSHLLLGLSLLLLWFFTYLTFLSGFEENHAQQRLYGELREQLALGTAPTGAPIGEGVPVALLDLPGTTLRNQVIVEGASTEALQQGPTHLPGSVLPGQAGVSMLLGRSLSFGAPFGNLPSMRKGQQVRVVTGQGRFTYAIDRIRRDGDPVPPPLAAGQSRLTLVTTSSTGSLSALRPSSTVYVDARLTSKLAASPGAVSAIDPATSIVRGHLDTATLAQLALALQLLALVLAGFGWAWRRWSRLGAWVAGLPVVVAALWFTSSLVSRLLPGLI